MDSLGESLSDGGTAKQIHAGLHTVPAHSPTHTLRNQRAIFRSRTPARHARGHHGRLPRRREPRCELQCRHRRRCCRRRRRKPPPSCPPKCLRMLVGWRRRSGASTYAITDRGSRPEAGGHDWDNSTTPRAWMSNGGKLYSRRRRTARNDGSRALPTHHRVPPTT